MDFEIEGDDEDSFDWNAAASNPPKKKSTFFGAGAEDDEDGYNFAYQKSETKNTKKYEPFSPMGQAAAPKGKDAPKSVVASSQDAMERAQSMLNRYSNKSLAAPASNFRDQKIRKFNEDEMSMSSSDGAPSDFEMSGSNEDFNHKIQAGKAKKQPDINALGSKAHVVVSMGDEEDDYSSEGGDVTASPPAPLQKQITRFSDAMEEGSDASEYSDEQFDADDNSVEESAEEVGESRLSRTVDTEPEESLSHSHRSSPGGGEDSRSRSRLSESYSPGENNASFSRLVYGNEDEGDEEENEEVDEEGHSGVNASSSSRPKVFSFADLLSQSSWDADRFKSTAESVPAVAAAEVAPVRAAEAPRPTVVSEKLPVTAAPTEVKTLSKPIPVQAASAVPAADGVVPQPSPVLREPALTRSPPRTIYSTFGGSAHAPAAVANAAPTQQPAPSLAPVAVSAAAPGQTGAVLMAPPAAASGYYPTAVDPSALPLPSYPAAPYQAPTIPGHPAAHPAGPYPQPYYPYPPPPPYYPYYPYPPAPHAYAPPPSAPTPPHMPMQPCPHPLYAPGGYGQHPYPEQYPHPQYHPWGREDTMSMRGSHSSFPAPLSVDPRASYLGRSRTDPLHSMSAFDRDVSQQPLVLDLLHELRKSKEEADWARRKLAETIVRLGDGPRSSASPVRERASVERDRAVPSRESAGGDARNVLSPVQPVRSALRFSNPVVSAPAAVPMQHSKPATTTFTRQQSSHEDVDEVSEEEEDEYAYDSDFDDDSPAKPPQHGKNARSAAAASHADSYSYSFDGDHSALEESKDAGEGAGEGAVAMIPVTAARSSVVAETPAVAPTSSAPGAASASTHRARQLDEYVEHDFAHAAPRDPAVQLRDRAKVLNPVRESLAHSLLASQELFKSQLESLRARINATNTYTDLMQTRLNSQWDELNGGAGAAPSTVTGATDAESLRYAREALLFDGLNRTSFTPAPTLRVVQGQFESQRASSADKLLDLLGQVYPNMTVAEARRLVAKF